jgi:hypothetical protein
METVTTPDGLAKFRNSVGFQFMFVLHSGLETAKAIDHICQSAEKLVAAHAAEYRAACVAKVRAFKRTGNPADEAIFGDENELVENIAAALESVTLEGKQDGE